MLIKVVNGKQETVKPMRYPHYTVTHLSDGLLMELGTKGPTIRLPDDGEAIFVMNDKGDTIDSYRWPPKVVEAELHTTKAS